MSFIGGLFSGSKGANFEPEQATGIEQAQEMYRLQQQRLRDQQAFTKALAGQMPQALQQQAMLGEQLAGAVQGTGPSVAQRQLAEATGQNVAGLSAALAGQRGASANVGLTGRNIGQLGARSQQEMAQQASTLRAQEQIAARQQLAALTGQQVGALSEAQRQGIAGTQGAYQAEQQAIAERNRINAIIASGNQQFQAGLVGGLLGAGASALKGGVGGGGGANMAAGGEVTNENDDEEQDDFFSTFSKAMSAQKPSQNPNYQAGQMAGQAAGQAAGSALSSLFGKSVQGQTKGGYAGANLGVQTQMPQVINPMPTAANIGAMKLGLSHGGKVPAMVSPGEKYLPPSEVKKVAKGEKDALSAGKTIPGKAKVSGDSYANDTVKATLQEGGIVIPRSVMQSDDPAEKARQFVAAVLAKKQAKR